MITVVGATGQVGNPTARSLLDDGYPVRVLGRNLDSLTALSARGADARQCDIGDPPALSRALAGSESVVAMMSSNPVTEHYAAQQHSFGHSICTAIESNSVPKVVTPSSLGADRVDAPGVIGSLFGGEVRS